MSDKPESVLAAMTWQQAQEALSRAPVGLLPIGAIEAHGPHLPLDTDIIIADAMARAAATRLAIEGIPSLVLPSIAYTVSFAGTSFPGTSPVASSAFSAYLTNVLSNLAPQGYRAIICCNAHLEPAHVQSVVESCHAAETETGIPIRVPDHRVAPYSNLLSDEFRAGARHAGSYETSIVMAARPELISTDTLAGLPPVWIDLPTRLREGARTFAEAGAELGYFGDPASASQEEGERMLAALAEIVWREVQSTVP